MLRQILFPLALGLAGCAMLLYLGAWQLQRLEWKESILADIDVRLTAAPVPLSLAPSKDADNYSRVSISGTSSGEELHVLVSGTVAGTGYRVVSAFDIDDGRRILLDQGLLPLDKKDVRPVTAWSSITGTLIWPDDRNSSTPDPDLAQNIWFARDVDAMAQALDTEPLMVVAHTSSAPDARTTLLPVDMANIKNDHLEYAITWFLLALVWAAMTLFLILRTTRQKDA